MRNVKRGRERKRESEVVKTNNWPSCPGESYLINKWRNLTQGPQAVLP